MKRKENECCHCKTERSYSEKYDSYYCKKCDYWLEKICPDRKCEFCSKKPKYPNDRNKNDIEAFLSIPSNCYTDTVNTPGSEKYEIFYDGEKVNNVFGVIRYAFKFDEDEQIKPSDIDWKKELGE